MKKLYKNKIFIGIVSVIVIIGIGTGVYAILSNWGNKDSTPDSSSGTSQQSDSTNDGVDTSNDADIVPVNKEVSTSAKSIEDEAEALVKTDADAALKKFKEAETTYIKANDYSAAQSVQFRMHELQNPPEKPYNTPAVRSSGGS